MITTHKRRSLGGDLLAPGMPEVKDATRCFLPSPPGRKENQGGRKPIVRKVEERNACGQVPPSLASRPA